MNSNSVVAQAKQDLREIQEPMIIHKTTNGHSTFTSGAALIRHNPQNVLQQSRKQLNVMLEPIVGGSQMSTPKISEVPTSTSSSLPQIANPPTKA